jgi:hypothetical protein
MDAVDEINAPALTGDRTAIPYCLPRSLVTILTTELRRLSRQLCVCVQRFRQQASVNALN